MSFKFIDLSIKGDSRGSLIALESLDNIPFEVKRVCYIYNTAIGVRRGFHAHKKLKQVAVCVKGSCKFLLDDGSHASEVILDKPNIALYIEGLLWREMFDFSDDCVLLVLADALYDEGDYIRDYKTFKELVNETIYS